MALLTVTQAKRAATPVALVPADSLGDSFPNTEREALLVQHTNPLGSASAVVLDIQATLDGEVVTDKVVSILPGETHLIGPFPISIYSNAQKEVLISYASVTDLMVAAVRISQ